MVDSKLIGLLINYFHRCLLRTLAWPVFLWERADLEWIRSLIWAWLLNRWWWGCHDGFFVSYVLEVVEAFPAPLGVHNNLSFASSTLILTFITFSIIPSSILTNIFSKSLSNESIRLRRRFSASSSWRTISSILTSSVENILELVALPLFWQYFLSSRWHFPIWILNMHHIH